MSRRPHAAFIGAALLGTSLTAPTSAFAYRTASDLPELAGTERVTWADNSVDYYVSSVDYPGSSFAAVTEGIAAGVAIWSGTGCGFDRFRYRGTDGLPTPDDGRNTIGWFQDNWVAAGLPSNAMAVTDVLYAEVAPGEWEIVEADVLVNGYDFRWVPGPFEGDPDIRSIETMIAHESGHMLGILHPCEVGAIGGVPICASNPAFADAAMYPLYDGTIRMELSADDVGALCHQFPPVSCEPPCADGYTCHLGACVVDGNNTTTACISDYDCTPTEVCVAHQCVPYVGQIGDPCVDETECAAGLCTEEGHCAEACSPLGGCPSPYACDATSQVCHTSMGEFGDSCEVGEDCASGLCLSGVSKTPFCTRTCPNAAPGACPPAYQCIQVDNTAVCRPEPDNGGCTVFLVSESSPQLVGVFLFFLVVLFRKRAIQ